jgi:DNA-binding transcriptional LysR family regulator
MTSRLPSLVTLRLFDVAARHQSFTRAGQEFGLTHAAVSQRLAALQATVGYRLFVRAGRRMVPTPDAQRLLPGTRQALRLLEAIYGRPAPQPTKDSHTLVLSCTLPFASRWLVPRMARFAAAHPDIELELRPSAEVLDLRRANLDAAIRYGPGHWPGLTSVHLADETVFPVASPSYKQRLRLRRPQDLQRAVLIRHPPQPWEPWLHQAGVELPAPPAGPLATETGLALDIAIAGGGVALGRQLLVENDLRMRRLVRLFDVTIRDAYAYHLVWLPGSPKAEAVDRLRRWLVAEIREQADRQNT